MDTVHSHLPQGCRDQGTSLIPHICIILAQLLVTHHKRGGIHHLRRLSLYLLEIQDFSGNHQLLVSTPSRKLEEAIYLLSYVIMIEHVCKAANIHQLFGEV